MKNVVFVTGIDTDAGKSYATGWYARQLARKGKKVITHKFIQTGNTDYSEDIEVHRRVMGIPMQDVDLDHTTAPVIFSYPASPQLAAQLDERRIDFDVIDRSLKVLAKRYDTVLMEGAGGLMVPLTDRFLTIDFVAARSIPVVLVTNGRLGSINHTLLALEAIKSREMKLAAVLYNQHFDYDPIITADTRRFIKKYVNRHFPGTPIVDVPDITDEMLQAIDNRQEPVAPSLQLSISKLQLAQMPQVTFPGTITVVDDAATARQAVQWLNKQKIVGFDTETRPSFRKGKVNNMALIQISTPRRCFLFRVNKMGFPAPLRDFIENDRVKKVGLSLKDDFNAMRRTMADLSPAGFIELQDYVRDFNIADASLQKVYGIIFSKRISKNQRLSNWEAPALSEAQQIYASIDAWAALRIYTHLEAGKFEPAKSPYKVVPAIPDPS